MARGFAHEWPKDDDIVAGCLEYGSKTAYTQGALNRAASTFARWLRVIRPDLDARIDAALKEAVPVGKKRAVPMHAPGDDISREEILELEVKELRSNARRDRKGEVEKERLTRSIEQALKDIAPPRRVGGAKIRKLGSLEPHHRQLLAISDWHGGEIVDPAQVNGLNEYSWDIMLARVDELVAGVLSHKTVSPRLSGLDIAIVGDMTSGHQHQELAETNEFPLAVQGVKMGGLIGTFIERLQPHFENFRIVAVPGNHPRLKHKPAAKNVADNMDWVSAMIAKEFLSKHPNIQFTVPMGAAIFHQIAGKTFYIWHGDGVRSSMPGVPWGGIMRRVNEIRRGFVGTEIDYWLCGHYHQCNVMKSLGIFMNGSLKGTDEWVIKNFGGGSAPEQLILTFSEKHQRLTDSRFLTPTAGLP